MNDTLRLSCALCTFNGERYIEGQLKSILQQQLPVDEIVICDDGSTDRTLEIIQQLKDECATEIRVIRNEKSLGVCANFKNAIELCTGDIIFLSDQDDLWMPDKTRYITDWFRQHPEKEVVFTDGELMDDDSMEVEGKTIFSVLNFPKFTQRLFDQGFDVEAFLKHNRAVGATMALRKSFVPFMTIDPYATSSNDLPLHDQSLALTAASMHKLGFITNPLIRYRIHMGQVYGFGAWLTRPPSFKNIVKPVVVEEKLLPHMVSSCHPRALFGKRRRKLARSWRKIVLFLYWKEYKEIFGHLALRPFLYDLFLF